MIFKFITLICSSETAGGSGIFLGDDGIAFHYYTICLMDCAFMLNMIFNVRVLSMKIVFVVIYFFG